MPVKPIVITDEGGSLLRIPSDPRFDSPQGDLRVWWIPQTPGLTFYVPVDSPRQGAKLLNVFADYDMFHSASGSSPTTATWEAWRSFMAAIGGNGKKATAPR